GNVTVRVPLSALRPAAESVATTAHQRWRTPPHDIAGRAVPAELMLIGRTTDETRDLVEKYLDDAFMAGIDDVRVVHGDTAQVPYGNGSNASRSTVMAGSAAVGASRKVKDKLLRLASANLEIGAADLILSDGRVVGRGAPERSLNFADLARLALPGPALKKGITPGISEEDFFATDKRPFPYGVHVAAVEVDKETGKIKILDYLVTEDVGRKINPMIIEGQMAGGLAQGIGGAILEEFVYSEDGQPLSTNFMDYLLPTAMEMPKVQLISTEDFPSPHNPLGVKGAGEGGTLPAPAAIANAVADAASGSGGRVTSLPISAAALTLR
ncbi:MAG: molybdopterin cofactor-binding domain-containing protein, partial [Burkholderiales bacterium]